MCFAGKKATEKLETLKVVSEEAKLNNTLLTPIEGPDTWNDDRRYLVSLS